MSHRLMTRQRIRAHDRRLAAIHEAGHLTVADLHGINLSSWIVPNETDDDVFEKTWIGRTQVMHVPRKKLKLVAVAGSVAEFCWRGDEIDPFCWYEPEVMSDSDWEMADCLPGQPNRACFTAIEEAGELLGRGGPLWSELIANARQLIVNSR